MTYLVTKTLGECTTIEAIVTECEVTDATIKFLESSCLTMLDNHFTRYGKDCLTFVSNVSDARYYVEPFLGKVL